MRVVVDASVMAAACLAEDGLRLLGRDELVAPALLTSEVASAVRGLEWRSQISSELASVALERLVAARVELVASQLFAVEAYDLARSLGWAKTYDAEYVALAMREGCPLLTFDDRLSRRVGDIVHVRRPQ